METKDKSFNKIMFISASLGNLSVIKHCIEKGADNFFDCCHEALFNKHNDIAMYFLESCEFENKQYKDLYAQAIRFGVYEAVIFLEKDKKCAFESVEEMQKVLHTCIHQAKDLKVLMHFIPKISNFMLNYLFWVSVRAGRPKTIYFMINFMKAQGFTEDEIFKEDVGRAYKEFSLEGIYSIEHLKQQRLKEFENDR